MEIKGKNPKVEEEEKYKEYEVKVVDLKKKKNL